MTSMKKLFAAALFFFTGYSIQAQENFQGEITYKLHANTNDKPDAELKILFGVNKLKLRFKEKQEYDKEYLLVVFDSAAIFVVNEEEKTYKKKPLRTSPPLKQVEKRTFAGQSATAYPQERTGLSALMGGLVSSTEAVFFLADSLYYYIPAIYGSNAELMAIQRNRIVLGAEIGLTTAYNEMPDGNSKAPDLITAEATEIRPMSISNEEFISPSDYMDSKDMVYAPVADSALAALDTIAVAAPPMKKSKTQPAKPNKSKTPAKTSAIKRKD